MPNSDRYQQLEEIRKLILSASYDQAILKIQDRLLLNPEDEDALALLGNIRELLQDNFEARKCYEKILELNPNNTAAWIDLGDHYSNLDNLGKAIEMYERACELIRKGIFHAAKTMEIEHAFFGVVLALKEQNRLHEAQSYLKEGIFLEPNSDMLNSLRAKIGL